MSFHHIDEPLVHNLGGGDDSPLRLVTNGQVRVMVQGKEPVLNFDKVVTEPVAASLTKVAQMFFRLDPEGKWQACITFPSGVTQVLVTEP